MSLNFSLITSQRHQLTNFKNFACGALHVVYHILHDCQTNCIILSIQTTIYIVTACTLNILLDILGHVETLNPKTLDVANPNE